MSLPALVIFDCDGVLIDSEPLCNRVVAEILTEQGWTITSAECQARFIGMSFHDMQPMVEARVGRALGAGWVDAVVTRVTTALAAEVEMVPGARDALLAVTAMGLPFRVASNSSHVEMAAKFGRTGLAALVVGRLHSVDDVLAIGGRGKPAPDLFLAAAAAEAVPPTRCVVIEDSFAGVTAAAAAGMRCFGFAPDGDGVRLRDAGAALLFRSMAELPALLQATAQEAA